MMAHTEDIAIQYEGPGVATELWGGTQANFLVTRHPHPAREVAVLLNDVAARYLATELGVEDTEAFREGAARVAGRIAIRKLWESKRRFDSIIVISRATFEEDPAFLQELRQLIADAATGPAERMAPQH